MENLIGGIIGLVFMVIFGLFWLFWLLMMVAIVGGMILWVLMIIDVAKREFKNPDDKTMWLLIVILTGIIGAVIYYFMIKRKDKK